jgi:hypothetical protein
MNVQTKFNTGDVVYCNHCRKIQQKIILGILIKANYSGLDISYYFTDGQPALPEEELYGSPSEVYYIIDEELKLECNGYSAGSRN